MKPQLPATTITEDKKKTIARVPDPPSCNRRQSASTAGRAAAAWRAAAPGPGTPVPRRARRTLLLLPAAAPARRSSPRSGPGRSSLRTAAAPPTTGAGRSASGRTARGRSRPAGCSSTGFPPCRPVGRSDGWIPRATAKEYGERRRKNKKQARSSEYLSRRITRLWQRRRGGDQRCVCGEARATKLPRPPPCEASTTTARGEARLRASFLRRGPSGFAERGGEGESRTGEAESQALLSWFPWLICNELPRLFFVSCVFTDAITGS
jgi:hypothetical protein